MTQKRDTIAGDIFELHKENPDFRTEDLPFHPQLGVLLFGIAAILSLPFAAVAQAISYAVDNRWVDYVRLTPHVCLGMIVALTLGELLGNFNEAAAEIDEKFGSSDNMEFYHCPSCGEFPTPIDNRKDTTLTAGAVGTCEHCGSLLWAKDHVKRDFTTN